MVKAKGSNIDQILLSFGNLFLVIFSLFLRYRYTLLEYGKEVLVNSKI